MYTTPHKIIDNRAGYQRQADERADYKCCYCGADVVEFSHPTALFKDRDFRHVGDCVPHDWTREE